MNELPASAMATRFDLTLLPREWESAGYWHLTVEWRGLDEDGEDRWAVCWDGRCATKAGVWSYERSPSNRTERWVKSHRFDLTTALALADRLLHKQKINGLTAADVITRHAATGATA